MTPEEATRVLQESQKRREQEFIQKLEILMEEHQMAIVPVFQIRADQVTSRLEVVPRS